MALRHCNYILNLNFNLLTFPIRINFILFYFQVCGKPFPCGFHKCEVMCHESICGDCPFSGVQKCPCGTVYKEVECPNEVSSCGGTCDKILPCGEHACPNKCHKGQCPQVSYFLTQFILGCSLNSNIFFSVP